jgi:hypothetical protein|tara:strand:- start:4174 stop:4821 length:648 start_codon:yes stop_codon:yes gene_type:complete
MSKRSIPVNRNELEQAVLEAEKSGPLVNLSAFYGAVATLYNGSKHATDMEITASIAMARIRSWDINVLTKAGKKGIQPGGVAVKKQAASVLCPLSEWKEYQSRTGTTIRLRLVIACDKYNWIFGQQREDTKGLSSCRFWPNFKILLVRLQKDCNIDASRLVIKALAEKLGVLDIEDGLSLHDIGMKLNEHYKVNFFVDDNIRDRVFADSRKENDA